MIQYYKDFNNILTKLKKIQQYYKDFSILIKNFSLVKSILQYISSIIDDCTYFYCFF